jgi:hypothetical protein
MDTNKKLAKQIADLQQKLEKMPDETENKKEKKDDIFPKSCFIKSGFSIEDALAESHKIIIRNRDSLTIMFSSCIALTKKGTYIVKERGIEMIRYKVKTLEELKAQLDFEIEYMPSREEILQAQRNHKKIEKYKIINLNSILKAKDFRTQCLTYDNALPQGDNKINFSLWRSPLIKLYLNPDIKYKKEIAERFISFVASRVKNPYALYDLINTMVFQIRNPGKKAIRFFICFDPCGMAYKSYTIKNLSRIYGDYRMMNVDPELMKDKFNE